MEYNEDGRNVFVFLAVAFEGKLFLGIGARRCLLLFFVFKVQG